MFSDLFYFLEDVLIGDFVSTKGIEEMFQFGSGSLPGEGTPEAQLHARGQLFHQIQDLVVIQIQYGFHDMNDLIFAQS